jgi:hypothetical protein
MKKLMILLLLAALLLTGCGSSETFETVSDEWASPVSVQASQIRVTLPPEAAAPAVESDAGRIYLCEDYEITVQTLSAGDVDATVRSVCGYGREDLTLLETMSDGVKRYEFVWTSVGETGDRVGRAAILDDGSHHYVLTVLGDAKSAGNHTAVWQEMFGSFNIGT